MFAAGVYGRFAHFVAGLNRGLATDEYRRVRDLSAFAAGDASEPSEARPAGDGAAGRPYFEVLIVDELSSYQEAALLEERYRLRRPTDQFVYEIRRRA